MTGKYRKQTVRKGSSGADIKIYGSAEKEKEEKRGEEVEIEEARREEEVRKIEDEKEEEGKERERGGSGKEAEGLYGRGLLNYREWWNLSEVDVYVNGGRVRGIPIFTEANTLRVVNGEYSYFIPLEKIDYIRTGDGLRNK